MNYLDRKELATHKGLVEGAMFVLSCDVENPFVDRRAKHDWRLLKKIDKGARFVVCLRPMEREDTDVIPDVARVELERIDWNHSILYRVPLRSDLFPLIVPHLVPVEETLDDILHKAGYWASAQEILELFVKNGTVSLDAIRAAVKEIRHRDDDETDNDNEITEEITLTSGVE